MVDKTSSRQRIDVVPRVAKHFQYIIYIQNMIARLQMHVSLGAESIHACYPFSSKMEEALSEDKQVLLREAGHDVSPSWRRLKWPTCNVQASTKGILSTHFDYVRATPGAKPTWVCLHCSWSNTMRGYVRPMEHLCFYEQIKAKNYMRLHGLENQEQIPVPFRQFLQKYAKLGNNTAACPHRLEKEQLLEYAAMGETAAVQWCQFSHWLPLDYRAGSVEPAAAPEEFNQAEAERRHVIAIVASGLSCSAGANEPWKHFFSMAAPAYDAPDGPAFPDAFLTWGKKH